METAPLFETKVGAVSTFSLKKWRRRPLLRPVFPTCHTPIFPPHDPDDVTQFDNVGVCDWLGTQTSDALPYWDRYDEGVFVGGRNAGSPMHVDQVTWSNVGKNYQGYKLLAVWTYGEASREIFDDHNYSLFTSPLSAAESEALARAVKVALLGPGDLVLFRQVWQVSYQASTNCHVTRFSPFVMPPPPPPPTDHTPHFLCPQRAVVATPTWLSL